MVYSEPCEKMFKKESFTDVLQNKCSEIFRNVHRKIPALRSLFNPEGLQLYLKETPTQVFPCEYYDMFKNTSFAEHLRWLLLLF